MSQTGSLLSSTYEVTEKFVTSIPKADRKRYGQFFTSELTARFMASLFTLDFTKDELRLLDAGAGTGLLTAALVEHLRQKGYSGTIRVTCYENDAKVLPVLKQNLELLRERAGIKYEICTDNYLTSQNFLEQDLYREPRPQYDLIIGNPPYLKIPKDAPEAKAMAGVCHGAPNLYFLFWAMGIANLKDDAELVYIIPRSWTSGAYFERFRRFLFQHCVITHIHIFGSRDKVFDGESVLQETMIIKVRKTRVRPATVQMSSSETSEFKAVCSYEVPYDTVVAPNQYVFLVTNKDEAEVLSRVNRQPSTLEADELKMRTGIIVDFRTQEVLRNEAEEGTYPLFFSSHIKDGRVQWPIGRESEYILTDHAGSLMAIYASKKVMEKQPVRINGKDFTFSPGSHNQLQKAIIEEFAPRFAQNAECLYVGDTVQKDLVKNVERLSHLGFEITLHDKMPDVVLYRQDKDWIYFVEAVTTVGPMDAKRILEINALTRGVSSGKIFVTAFLDFATYKKFAAQLAWETEVWIAEMPEHMIHLNGDKFLGPR